VLFSAKSAPLRILARAQSPSVPTVTRGSCLPSFMTTTSVARLQRVIKGNLIWQATVDTRSIAERTNKCAQ
jgi:hypothetical protein